MPAGDHTGPTGAGPRTGRGLGYCSGYDTPGYMQPGPGRGWGRGMGRGRGWGRGRGRGWGRGYGMGWRHGYGPMGMPYPHYGHAGEPYPPTPEQEIATLRSEAEHLEAALADVRRRIDELSAARAENDADE